MNNVVDLVLGDEREVTQSMFSPSHRPLTKKGPTEAGPLDLGRKGDVPEHQPTAQNVLACILFRMKLVSLRSEIATSDECVHQTVGLTAFNLFGTWLVSIGQGLISNYFSQALQGDALVPYRRTNLVE